MKHLLFAGLCAAALSAGAAQPAKAQAENPNLGDIITVGFNFCPRGWAVAGGQLLPVSQHTALFSLYGTQYGGDGRTTFALPDLIGRVPINYGRGPGLSDFRIGQRGGAQTHSLNVTEMPNHNHAARYSDTAATEISPVGHSWSNNAGQTIYAPNANAAFESDTVGNTGGGVPFSTVDPIIALNYCVAMVGSYPSRP